MAVNSSSQFNSGTLGTATGSTGTDVENYIAEKTLPLAVRQLVAYQFGDALRLPKNRGLTYTASRYERVPLPYTTLSEGVPPIGQTMPLQQVQATAQQWGDKVTLTDVGEMTVKHDLFQKAIELCGTALAETLERNTYNNLLAGTQVNTVNKRGSRFLLQSGDVMNVTEINRAVGALRTLGAPRYNGDEREDMKIDAGKPGTASSDPRKAPHYVAIVHPLVEQDLRANTTIVTAWSYSDINRLYNNELGEWAGIRFCASNMVPSFTGYAQLSGTAGTSGSLATNSYYLVVTGSDTQNQYESYLTQVTAAISVTGPNGSISVTTPNVTGYTWSVYIGTTTTPTNLGVCASGPVQGPLAGQATQLPSNTTVVITNTGVAQTPPSPAPTGVTVFPTFVFGKHGYGQIVLDDAKFTYLKTADKTDPLNQLRIVGWKIFYGTIILQNKFFMRIESASAYAATFS